MLTAIRNTIANFIGGMTTLAALLVFNALYFRMVGAEEFGIISILLTVSLMVPGLDLGTGRTISRILSRDIALGESGTSLHTSVATLQITNLAIGLALGAGLMLLAPVLSNDWLKPQDLLVEDVAMAIILIAANIPLLMQKNYVVNCLIGLKRQIEANILLTVFTILRGIAGLVALSVDGGGLHLFLWSQLILQAMDTLVSIAVTIWLLPASERRISFSLDVLRNSWRFSAADGTAALIGVCLAQADKVLLSNLLPLSSYGSYALIATIASGIGRFTSPFSSAFMPHFTELTALNKIDELRKDYLVSTQLLSCVVLPLAVTMIAFAPEIVIAVLGKQTDPGYLPLVFAVLVASTILGNLMYLPHGIQIAAGNAVTALRFSAAKAIIYVALILIATPKFGIAAPAFSLLAIQSVAIVLFTRVTHQMLDLIGMHWAQHSLIRPMAGALPVVILAWVATPAGLGMIAGVIWLSTIMLAAAAASLALSPGARVTLVARLKKQET